MAEKNNGIQWRKIKEEDKDRLLYQMSVWFAQEKLTDVKIAKRIADWLSKHVKYCCGDNPKVPVPSVGKFLRQAAQKGLLAAIPTRDQALENEIRQHFQHIPPITVTPDRSSMLRFAWDRVIGLLLEKFKTSQSAPFVLGLSGGRTILDLVNSPPSDADERWRTEAPQDAANSITVCSLTVGGMRDAIDTLSDTVAAVMARRLGAHPRGLLGPPWFANALALEAFRQDPEIVDHINLAAKASLIVTSVGYLGDGSALMARLLGQHNAAPAGGPVLSDILYNCYNGSDGTEVPLDRTIADHLFTVIKLDKLRGMVQSGTKCLMLASGKQKGRHSIRGLLIQNMVSEVFMDRECAQGLIETLKNPPHE